MHGLEPFNGNVRLSAGRSATGVVTLLSAALLYVAAVVLGFSMVARMHDSGDWVVHTYDARSQIRALKASFTDVTSEVASAAALNDPRHLSGIGRQLVGQKETLSRLRLLVGDNPSQQGRLDQLEPLMADAATQLAACSEGLRCLPDTAKERQDFLRRMSDRQDQALFIIDSTDAAEKALLELRLSAWNRRFRLMVVALGIAVVSATFLVAVNFRLLLNEIDRRSRSEQLVREHMDSYRAFSGRILELQDAERRKIARELHDSAGQYLAAVKLTLRQLERAGALGTTAGFGTSLAEACELIDRCLAEIRTISHLLHPPLLDETGLYSAARWYVQGFAERSGIKVDLTVDDFPDRLHRDTEIALFRVLQEALTNVHKHSGAKSVLVDMSCRDGQAILVVKDDGRGIPPHTLRRFQEGHGGGIGLAGMRERLNELGGTLEVESSTAGTLLRAAVPSQISRPETPAHQSAAVGA